ADAPRSPAPLLPHETLSFVRFGSDRWYLAIPMSWRSLVFVLLASLVTALGPACSSTNSSEQKVGPFEANVAWPHLTCDPISPAQCGYPFPSNVYTVDAPDTPTGRRVAFDDAMMPVALNGSRSSGAPWSKSDGFSSSAALLAHLAGATVEGLSG